MTWNVNTPLGSVSVKSNKSRIAGNFQYITEKMGNHPAGDPNTNTLRDHFWDTSSALDGRHRFIKSPGYTVSGSPADPVMGNLCDSVTYCKLLSSTVSTAQQDVQPFYQNSS